MIKKHFLRNFFIILFFLLSNNLIFAQPTDPGDGDPEQIPLDPGTWVLVAAGVGYGVKKMREAKNKLNTDTDEKKEFK